MSPTAASHRWFGLISVRSNFGEGQGFTIPAQQKLLRQYAYSRQMRIVKEFVDVETAKQTGRKQFGEMVRFFENNPECRTVIVEKTDRLYRNFRDSLTLEDLGVEIHLVKDGLILSKESKSQERLVHGFHLLLAKNYSDNLREEVRKGMQEKAAQGKYSARAPLGYRNNILEHTIEVDPATSPIVRRILELFATGKYSLATLRETIVIETGRKIPKSYLEKLLKSPFYCGLFVWSGKTYQGTHTPIISADLFALSCPRYFGDISGKRCFHLMNARCQAFSFDFEAYSGACRGSLRLPVRPLSPTWSG